MRATPTPMEDDQEDFFLMASLAPEDTGLPMVAWISERGRSRHDARVRIALRHGRDFRPDPSAWVSVQPDVRVVVGSAPSPSDLDQVRRWIELNRDAIVDYWNGDLLTDEAIARLRPIQP